jgi:serine/threonine-protein kinase
VYSLGIVLYEMVAGAPPFLGENAVGVAYKQVHDQPRPLNQIVLDIPRAFEAIVAKCLAKDPVIRYQSADALRDDLRRYREGADVGALIEALGGSLGAATTVMATTPMTPRGDAMTTQAMPVVGANDAVTPAAGVPVSGPGGTQVMPQVAVPQGAVLPPYEDDRPRRGGGYVVAAVIAVLALLGGGFALFRSLTGAETTSDFTVPNVVNLSLADASKVLLDRGLTPIPLPVAKDGVGDDVVYSQDPLPDVVLRKGDEVKLTYNPKKAPVVVPAIQGLTVKDATALLLTKGLTLTIAEVRNDASIPLNQIISQDPGGNAEVPAGSAVKVVVSGGAGQVTVPSIDGQLQEAAEKLLKSAPYNFIVTVQTEVSDTVEKGRVVRTDPAIGAPIDSGDTIVIYISSGPQQVEVPDVEGRTEGEARVSLNTRGLAVEVIYVDVPAGSLNDGKVISQGVPFKTMVDPNTSIKLTVGKAVAATTTTAAPAPATTVAPTVAPPTSGA